MLIETTWNRLVGRPRAGSADGQSRISFGARQALWPVMYALYYGVARHLPESTRPYGLGMRTLRYWICRWMFTRCGRHVNIEHGAYFGHGRGIEIGDESGIGVNCRVGPPLTIGKYVMMGPDVVILAQNHQFSDVSVPMALQGFADRREVVIEDDVWIGTRALILPGCRIGKGAIVGAGAVVTKDVPPFAIVGGNPARVLRYREPASAA